jgi:DNA-binding MarR family transcriptional regulator
LYDEIMKTQKVSEVQAEEFALAIGLIVRRVRAKAPAELREFSWTQKSVLKRLESDGPATSAELARAESVTPQSMGTAIAALEEMGLVERKAHPQDGRQMVVKLTAKGKSLREHTKAAQETWLTQALEKLDKQELAILFKASEIMKRMAEKP